MMEEEDHGLQLTPEPKEDSNSSGHSVVFQRDLWVPSPPALELGLPLSVSLL